MNGNNMYIFLRLIGLISLDSFWSKVSLPFLVTTPQKTFSLLTKKKSSCECIYIKHQWLITKWGKLTDYSILKILLASLVFSMKQWGGQCQLLQHLFAVDHLMVKEEEHSLLTLKLRLRQFGQLPRKYEFRAPAEHVLALQTHTHKYEI